MTGPAQLIRRLAGLSAARHGWIGVDVGTNSATFAQVRRQGTEWCLVARWRLENDSAEARPEIAQPATSMPPTTTSATSTPAASTPDARPTDTSSPELAGLDPGAWLASHRENLRRARGLLQGKNAAVCLSSAATLLRTVQIPDGTDDDRADMIRQELAADDEADTSALEFDAWPADAEPAGGRRIELVTVAVRGDVSNGVAEGLFRAGYHPRVLDAAPCAMARAIRLCDPFCDEPTIALKIDDDSAMFVLIRNGRPGFCRVLRGRGLRALAEPLVAKLGMTPRECRQVLLRHGIPGDAAVGAPSSDSFFRLISIPLEKLVDEMKRTCAFLDHGKPADRPARVWLFGDGAAVRNLPAFLSTRCGVPTVGWSPAFPVAGPVDDVRFGIAAGLSALGWEI
jgi:Tfp pilus assembly PilM family ATPase